MRQLQKIIVLISFICPIVLMGQLEVGPQVLIKGSVKEKKSYEPISDVGIRITGGTSTTTDIDGRFAIKAVIGEELIISHNDFETIYYTIKDGQRIDVLVEEAEKESGSHKKQKDKKKSSSKAIATSSDKIGMRYELKLKEAQQALKTDAAKSIEYIAAALELVDDNTNNAVYKKAALYELLGDVYRYWKQPDLAASNYETSAGYYSTSEVMIKLGEVQIEEKAFEQALRTFQSFDRGRLQAPYKIGVYEGLGDAYRGLTKYPEAIRNYEKALAIAEGRKENDQTINLQTKVAEVYELQGDLVKANKYYDQSLILANRQDKKTAALQKNKAADFYNKNNSFDKEIIMRKAALEDIEVVEEVRQQEVIKDSISKVVRNDQYSVNAISPQVQNYKIARAFAAQQNLDQAVSFLEESIKLSEAKNDLVVQKDATRKLGEVYRQKGALKKAAEAFENYEIIIDKLYIQKEQEISQAARFSRQLTDKQNRITSLEKDRELNESRYKLAYTSQELSQQRSFQQQLVIYALVILSLLMLFAGYLMYRNMRQQRNANNVLALKSLRSQMNPHFIFNALNSVNTFIATSDERAANKYLTDFSLLMRSVLENSEQDFIPLEKEITLLERYVQLEHFRFQDKFDYEIEVDPQIPIKSYQIPPMLLQPYVENAVWHGLRYKEEKGFLKIKFENFIEKDGIKIQVVDNGIGRTKSKSLKTVHQKKQESKGMSNVQNRIRILNEMYKDCIQVAIEDGDAHGIGTRVTLILKKQL